MPLFVALAALGMERPSGRKARHSMAVRSRAGKKKRTSKADVENVKFCVGCQREHSYKKWQVRRRGTDAEYAFCWRTYMQMYRGRLDHEPNHPAWPRLAGNLHATDSTGARVCATTYRADVRALLTLRALCLASRGPWARVENILLLGAFALQAYFLLPMLRLWDQVKTTKPDELAPGDFLKAWDSVASETIDLRAVNGVPTFKPPGNARGVLMMKNPSERRDGRALLKDLDAELAQWKRACVILKPLFEAPGPLNLVEVPGGKGFKSLLPVCAPPCFLRSLPVTSYVYGTCAQAHHLRSS